MSAIVRMTWNEFSLDLKVEDFIGDDENVMLNFKWSGFCKQ